MYIVSEQSHGFVARSERDSLMLTVEHPGDRAQYKRLVVGHQNAPTGLLQIARAMR